MPTQTQHCFAHRRFKGDMGRLWIGPRIMCGTGQSRKPPYWVQVNVPQWRDVEVTPELEAEIMRRHERRRS